MSPARSTALVKSRIRHIRIAALPLAALFLVSQPVWDADGWLGDATKWAGSLAVTLGVLGRCWCAAYVAGRKNRVLVTVGPYSVVRNPLYLFSFAGVVGIGLVSGMIGMAALLGALFLIYHREVARQEEVVLEGVFGSRYAAYRDRVPAWLPSFRLWQEPPSIDVELKPFLCSIRDSAWFFAAIPAFALLEALQRAGAVSVVLRLP